MKTLVSAVCAVVGFIATSAAWADDPSPDLIKQAAATNGGEIVVEHAFSSSTVDDFVNTFNQTYAKQGLHVKLIRYQTNQLVELYKQELRANKVGVDVMFLGDPSVFLDLQKENELTPYCSSNFKDYRPQALSSDCAYFDVTSHFQYLVYNSDEIKGADVPTSWLDLVNPKWKGKTSILDPRDGGGTDFFVFAMYKLFGRDFFLKAKANNVALAQSHNITENSVMSGERYISLSISDLTRLDGPYPGGKGAPIKEVFPKEGANLIAGGMGIAKNDPNPPGAKVFIDWASSLAGQRALSRNGFFSLRKDFTDVEGDDLSKIPYHWWDPNEMAEKRDAWVKDAASILLGN